MESALPNPGYHLRTVRASPSAVFCCAKLHRPVGSTRDAALVVGGRAREPPQIFSCLKKFGYPGLASDFTLVLSSLVADVLPAQKTFPPTDKAQELQPKGTESELQVSFNCKNYASKENDHRRGTALQHQQFPQLPQVRLSRRHEEALLWAECPVGTSGRLYIYYIYKVDEATYNQATI